MESLNGGGTGFADERDEVCSDESVCPVGKFLDVKSGEGMRHGLEGNVDDLLSANSIRDTYHQDLSLFEVMKP